MISGSWESVGDLESNTHTRVMMMLVSIKVEQTSLFLCIQNPWTSSSFFTRDVSPDETQTRSTSLVWALYSQKPSLLHWGFSVERSWTVLMFIDSYWAVQVYLLQGWSEVMNWSSALNHLFQDQLKDRPEPIYPLLCVWCLWAESEFPKAVKIELKTERIRSTFDTGLNSTVINVLYFYHKVKWLI